VGGLAKVAVGCELGPQIGQSLNGSEERPEIGSLQGPLRRCCEKPERYQRSIALAARLLVSLVPNGAATSSQPLAPSQGLRACNLRTAGRSSWNGLTGEALSQDFPATFLDRRGELAHTSAKLPAPLAFCRIYPGTFQPREACGCASVQVVQFRRTIQRAR
jgi:hypothetical protein